MRLQRHVVLVDREHGLTPLVVGPFWRRFNAMRVAARFRIERNEPFTRHTVRVVPLRTMHDVLDNPPWEAG